MYSIFLSSFFGDMILCVSPCGMSEFFGERSIPAPFFAMSFETMGEAEKVLSKYTGPLYIASKLCD